MRSYQTLVVMFLFYGSHGFAIHDCYNETIAMFEDSPATFTCTNIPRDAEVRWALGGSSNLEIGICYKNGSCQGHYSNQAYNFSRSANVTESHMTIWKDHRNFKTRSLVCYDGTVIQPYSQQCHFIIKSHPKLENCNITNDDFTVTGICQVTNAYSSDDIYRCIWKQNNIQQNVSNAETTKYNNQTGREYLDNWTCSFSQPLPKENGLYDYSISADTFQTQECSKTITVDTPGNLSSTCPKVIEEGKSLRCQCKTNKTGAPPALVFWDGYNSDTLEIGNVRLENNGSNFTCLLVWRNNTYTFLLYSLTVTQTVTSASPTGGDDDDDASSQGFPVLLIILAALGAVLAITVVAILVVCFTRIRRGKQQDRGRLNFKEMDREEKLSMDTAPSAPTKDDQDIEEHVNVLYGVCGDLRTNHSNDFEEHVNVLYEGCGDLRTNHSNDLAENMDATYAVVDKTRLKNRLK